LKPGLSEVKPRFPGVLLRPALARAWPLDQTTPASSYCADRSRIKANKTILVDEAVWTLAQLIAALTTQGKLEPPVGPKEWICWTLSALNTLGYTEHSTDERGNLVFKSTPALLADRGQKSNELYDRKYFFSDGQL
jgi:hypothetical protein